jgi:hypothetical protein
MGISWRRRPRAGGRERGVMQLSYMNNLFAPRKWYDVVPDQTNTVVNHGDDTFGAGSVTTDTYSTAARTLDGGLIMSLLDIAERAHMILEPPRRRPAS